MIRAHLAPLFAVPMLVTTPQFSRAQWSSDGTPVCVAPNPQRYPKIVPDGAGGAIIAWFDYRNGNWDVFAQHVLASGIVDPTWEANGATVCDAANSQTYVQVVSDGAGGAIVAWQDQRSGTSDIYAQHVLPSGVDPAWSPNGALVCGAANHQSYPQMVSDGAGGAIVAWIDWRDPSASDIYAQHVLAFGTIDPAWAAAGNVVCGAVGNQNDMTIVSDGAGGAIVAWSDFRSGTQADIYANHLPGSGVSDPAWPANGRLLCGAAGDQVTSACTFDGAGGAIIVWQDYRLGAGSDLYAQHVLGSGVVDPAWSPDGTLLCDAAQNQNYPEIASDGAGGAIATWEDHRNGTNSDVFAQRVLATGSVDPTWTPNGTPLCDLSNDQTYPRIASDGGGGAIVIWCDGRGGDSDLYAQHLLGSGSPDPAWTAGGAIVCNATGNQVYPEFIPDGAGGALITWFDYRGGSGPDIYAQRLTGNGGVTSVPQKPWGDLAIRGPYPNPARGAGTTIALDLPAASRISAGIYSALGQLVRTLARERELPAGRQSLTWDGLTERGIRASAGLYFVLLRVDEHLMSRRFAVLR